MSTAAPVSSSLSPPPAGLSVRDWGWSAGLHAGVVLATLAWAIAEPKPEFTPLPVTLSWQLEAPAPPPLAADVATQATPEPVPAARVSVSPAALSPKAARSRARASDKTADVVAPADAPVLQSVPDVAERTVAPVRPSAPEGGVPADESGPAVTNAVPATPSAVTTPAVGPSSVEARAQGEDAYQRWRDHLMRALHQHKRYPQAARRMGQSGTVMVQLRLSASGELLAVELAKSSGFKALDSAAEQLVRKVVQELAGQLTPGRATELRIPVVYELTES